MITRKQILNIFSDLRRGRYTGGIKFSGVEFSEKEIERIKEEAEGLIAEGYGKSEAIRTATVAKRKVKAIGRTKTQARRTISKTYARHEQAKRVVYDAMRNMRNTSRSRSNIKLENVPKNYIKQIDIARVEQAIKSGKNAYSVAREEIGKIKGITGHWTKGYNKGRILKGEDLENAIFLQNVYLQGKAEKAKMTKKQREYVGKSLDATKFTRPWDIDINSAKQAAQTGSKGIVVYADFKKYVAIQNMNKSLAASNVPDDLIDEIAGAMERMTPAELSDFLANNIYTTEIFGSGDDLMMHINIKEFYTSLMLTPAGKGMAEFSVGEWEAMIDSIIGGY